MIASQPALAPLALLAALACSPGYGDDEVTDQTPAVGAVEPAPVTEHRAALGDLGIHYVSAGTGDRALVFVHGWSCDHTFFAEQVPELADLGRVLAVDLPGHGRSEVPEDLAVSMVLFADAVAAVMDDAGVEAAVIVGHSNGSGVARQFLRSHPGRTLGLVVADGTLVPWTTDKQQLAPMIAPFRGDDYQDRARAMMLSMIPPSFPEERREQLIAAVLRTPQHVMIDSMYAFFAPEVWPRQTLDVPLLCVMSPSDFWNDAYQAALRTQAPDLRWEELPGAGHLLMLSAPERFNALVRDFVEDRGLLAPGADDASAAAPDEGAEG